MPIYFYRRQCKYPDCEKFFPIGIKDQYCDEHYLTAKIEAQIRKCLKEKRFNKKINEMKKEKYNSIYKKAFDKIMKEEKEKEK